MKYLTKIYWSEEDDAYVAEVPALRGCVAHGRTYAKAAAAIEEAMELWVDCAKRHGDSVPDEDLAREEIDRLAPLLNIAKLARLTGINPHTLASKLRRGSRFTSVETGRILTRLRAIG